MCLSKWLFRENFWSHKVHSYGFNPSWTVSWCFFKFAKLLWQSSHSNFSTPKLEILEFISKFSDHKCWILKIFGAKSNWTWFWKINTDMKIEPFELQCVKKNGARPSNLNEIANEILCIFEAQEAAKILGVKVGGKNI